MPRKLSDEDYDAIAEAVARHENGRESEISSETRIPAGMVWASICGVVLATVYVWTFVMKVESHINEAVTIEYMREWSKDAHRLNPGWTEPDPYEVHRKIK